MLIAVSTVAAPTANAAPANLAGMIVFLDPGHNGANDASISRQVPTGRGGTKDCQASGTSTDDGYPEHTFNWDTTLRVRAALGPRLCTSLGPKATARLRGGSYGLPAKRFDGACAQVPHRFKGVTVTDRRFVERAHRAGLQVHVWTIDDPDEMHLLLDLGVDGIMTDRPAVLREVLEARGAWFGPARADG